MNDLSFGIFALHGPILFSLCIILQQFLMKYIPYSMGAAINILISTIVVMLAAALFNKSVQPIVDLTLEKLKRGKKRE